MAVYTPVTEKDLKIFLECYELGALVTFKGISEGIENTNFLVVTTIGHYILTIFERRVSPSDLPWFVGLMGHLSAKGIDCPLPIADKKGEAIQTLMGKPAVLCSFLQGKGLDHPQTFHCRQVGTMLAHLHVAGHDYKAVRANNMGVKNWLAMWEKCMPHADFLQKDVRSFIEEQLAVVVKSWPTETYTHAKLPKGQIHADLFPDNVFFLKEKLSGIIDFYFACTDFWAYDIAVCINSWCFNAQGTEFYKDRMTAMLQGYEEVRLLTIEEKATLPLFNKGAALRFFLSRLYDWENTPENAVVVKKNPLDYVNRVQFFSLGKSTGNISL